MNRHEFFKKRLTELGLYDADADYGDMIGKSVEQLSEMFSSQGHSGMSAQITLAVFMQLIDEWEKGIAR